MDRGKRAQRLEISRARASERAVDHDSILINNHLLSLCSALFWSFCELPTFLGCQVSSVHKTMWLNTGLLLLNVHCIYIYVGGRSK